MSDSVDRVFAHALQTVRKIPRKGSARPPPEARLQLYGLYKQSMEGDVEGVMSRPSTPNPTSTSTSTVPVDPDAHRTEVDKWEAWHAQAGLSRTEAKRRYVTTLIETMHRYASATPEARELVSELEFVWDQIRSNVPSTHSQSYGHGGGGGGAQLEDEELEMELGLGLVSPKPYGEEVFPSTGEEGEQVPRERAWRGRVENALAKMATEVAALREQLESRRVEKSRARAKKAWVWFAWAVWASARHLAIEAIFWGLVLLWMRKRGDRRAEEALRVVGRFVKEGLREMGLLRKKR
ncbi:acyl CoA binding protein-domain-containing protein [Tricharina praecox]|uniref:acyl CoA binding protein-domain-containing protein n=1 Tax=Tricharina praecox TaxID=43433 RepID=UPI002220C470|nr:acyl CoA binding protein-domain-containing protein [Tricharina praecox]KAI5852154.1 acyl CoA binding protein-domain-containing protein [Tricharina praecox]